jgi:hypothetical protein
MTVNHNLKNALADARLSIEEFASILAVDPKSVGRWIAGTSTPYPRHRAAISRALALEETVLWPDRAPTPAAVSDEDGPHGATAPRGGEVTAWADSSDPSAPDPIAVIAATDGPIDVLSDENWFELPGPVSDALIAHAAAGNAVRVASTAPRPNLAPLIAQPGIELRCVEATGIDVVHAGTRMLIATRLGGFVDQPIALLQAEVDGADGLYDRIAAHFGLIWNHAYDELEGELEDDDVEPVGEVTTPSETSNMPGLSEQSSPPPPARRWPGSRG